MKKISIFIIAAYISILSAYGQKKTDSTYQLRKLKIEEVNFATGYYTQEGNNSAVTGGIGSEALSDLSNSFEIKVSKKTLNNNTHSLNFEMGVDVYTSASSDQIDPFTVSSASYQDERYYPSLQYNFTNENKNYGFGAGISYSKEYDYTSNGFSLNFNKISKDNNREFNVRFQTFLDTWKVILPFELRPQGYGSGSEKDPRPVDYLPRNSYNLSLTFSQVINERMQIAFLLDPSIQDGLLSTRFHRSFFTDLSARIENLPSERLKIPLGIRLNYFWGDRVIIRSLYRYYWDNWGMQANNLQLESAIKLSPFFSVSPFYRFYAQNAVDYFQPYGQHRPNADFYTSDFDLSAFTSNFFGLNLRLVSAKGILGINHFQNLELRYGFYDRSTSLKSHIITLVLGFK